MPLFIKTYIHTEQNEGRFRLWLVVDMPNLSGQAETLSSQATSTVNVCRHHNVNSHNLSNSHRSLAWRPQRNRINRSKRKWNQGKKASVNITVAGYNTANEPITNMLWLRCLTLLLFKYYRQLSVSLSFAFVYTRTQCVGLTVEASQLATLAS